MADNKQKLSLIKRVLESRDRARITWAMSKRFEHLLLVSHMRSYSSLLSHLIGAHPEVNGYVEQQIGYPTAMSLLELRFRTYEVCDGALPGRYLFDKVLHNRLLIGEPVVTRPDVKLVLSIREPISSVQSTVVMARRNRKPGWKGEIPKVAGYYRERLAAMVKIAEQKGGRGTLFLDAQQVVDDTAGTLAGIQKFMVLETPFSDTYKPRKFTGKPLFGDPSPYISAGEVVKDRPSNDHIELSPKIQEELIDAHTVAAKRLRNLCQISL